MTLAAAATPSFSSVPSRDSLSRARAPSLPFLFRKANKARVDGILCARKNVTAPGMNLDYGNARRQYLFSSPRLPAYRATDVNESPRRNVFLADLDLA